MNKQYEVEFLNKKSGCYINATNDYIEAESKEETYEFAKDWMKEQIMQSRLDWDEMVRETNNVDTHTFRVRECRGLDKEEYTWTIF